MNVYDTIIENIQTEKSPWCQDSFEEVKYTESEDFMKPLKADPNVPISRCLVGHVRFALGTDYVTIGPRGGIKRHRSKDKTKLRLQDTVLGHLADVIGGSRHEPVENYVIGWNDGGHPNSPKTKQAVIGLLRRASKKYPEDVAA